MLSVLLLLDGVLLRACTQRTRQKIHRSAPITIVGFLALKKIEHLTSNEQLLAAGLGAVITLSILADSTFAQAVKQD